MLHTCEELSEVDRGEAARVLKSEKSLGIGHFYIRYYFLEHIETTYNKPLDASL